MFYGIPDKGEILIKVMVIKRYYLVSCWEYEYISPDFRGVVVSASFSRASNTQDTGRIPSGKL